MRGYVNYARGAGVALKEQIAIEFGGCNEGPSAFDPRSGSIFFGGLSISPLYRRFIVAFPGLWIADVSPIYRRYYDDISTIFQLNATFVFISCMPQ